MITEEQIQKVRKRIGREFAHEDCDCFECCVLNLCKTVEEQEKRINDLILYRNEPY